MTNETIYHRLKSIILWAKWVRICPVSVDSSGTVHNVYQGYERKKDSHDIMQDTNEGNGAMNYYYYKFSNVQLFFNIIYIFITAALGFVGQMILLNMCQTTIEVLGVIVHMFTETVLPLVMSIFTNKNTGKVIINVPRFNRGN